MKNKSIAPLPFQGQKRGFAKEYKKILIENFDENYTYVDLFGGSGLLARITKDVFPKAKVVWNDYDNYIERCKKVKQTNEILEELRKLMEEKKIKKNAKMKKEEVDDLKKILSKYDDFDFITLMQSLCFSGVFYNKIEEFIQSNQFYNRVRINNIDCENCLNFHADLIREAEDYSSLMKKFKDEKVVFILDPPYLSTDQMQYSNYFDLIKTIELCFLFENKKYIFFTSNKSNILELDEKMKEFKKEGFFKNVKYYKRNNFVGAGKKKVRKYEEYMIIKKD